MQIEIEKASTVFESLPPELQIQSLHPRYVFADSQREEGLTPVCWYYEDNGFRYLHSFHLSQIPRTSYFDIQSAYGYGGVLSESNDVDFLSKAQNAYIEWCLNQKVVVEFIRMHPLCDSFRWYHGEASVNRETVWIDLTLDGEFFNYRSRARRKVRNAIRSGLSVHWTSGAEWHLQFAKFYRQAMSELNANEFYLFSDDYFKRLSELTNHQYAFCYQGDQLTGAALFLMGNGVIEYHLGGSNAQGRESGAMSLLFHEAALKGREFGYNKLFLGGGTNSDPDNPLLYFKSGFSNHRAEYRIGKFIHNLDAYDELKQEFSDKYASNSHRILFYR